MLKNTQLSGLLIACALLVGCSTAPSPVQDALTQELQQQAAKINRQLPVTENGIILVRAAVDGHQMNLQLYQSKEDQDVELVIQRYGEFLCRQPDVRQRMARGAQYRIEWRDSANKRLDHSLEKCNVVKN